MVRMSLSLEDQLFIESMVDQHGLTKAWKRMLVARVVNTGESYSYILQNKLFRDIVPATQDVLAHMTIGEVSVAYEYALAYSDRAKRKVEGQYFTPDDVSQFLASHARTFPHNAIWADPCSGVGNLSYWLVKQQVDPERFLLARIYLIDLDALALISARVLFTLAFQNKEDKLFNKLEDRFLERNFLTANDLPKFDAAILNPPYVSGVFSDTFATAATRNMYAYFLEKVATLASMGYISITPQTFTNGSRFSSLRKLLINQHRSLDVYCFDNVPDNIFSGVKFGSGNTNKANSTRAGIIVAKCARAKKHRITPLLRWRSHERSQVFSSAPGFLTEVTFTEDVFPKISRDLKTLYKIVRRFDRVLGDIISQTPTAHALQVPTTPRYFISANKHPVQRTSFRTLYFDTPESFNSAYVLLNSSYMYWWWRVNDGGMTISEKTLLELPIPSLDPFAILRFVKELEASERCSKVVKLNAGKQIENIKHPQELVRSITAFLFPEYVTHLSATHANSNLGSARPETKVLFA